MLTKNEVQLRYDLLAESVFACVRGEVAGGNAKTGPIARITAELKPRFENIDGHLLVDVLLTEGDQQLIYAELHFGERSLDQVITWQDPSFDSDDELVPPGELIEAVSQLLRILAMSAIPCYAEHNATLLRAYQTAGV